MQTAMSVRWYVWCFVSTVLFAHAAHCGDYARLDESASDRQDKAACEWRSVHTLRTYWVLKTAIKNIVPVRGSNQCVAQIGETDFVAFNPHTGLKDYSFSPRAALIGEYVSSIAPVSSTLLMTSGPRRILWDRRGRPLLTFDDENGSAGKTVRDCASEILVLPDNVIVAGTDTREDNRLTLRRLPINASGALESNKKATKKVSWKLGDQRVQGLQALSGSQFIALLSDNSIRTIDAMRCEEIDAFEAKLKADYSENDDQGRKLATDVLGQHCAVATRKEACVWDVRSKKSTWDILFDDTSAPIKGVALHDNYLAVSAWSHLDPRLDQPVKIYDMRALREPVETIRHDQARLCFHDGVLVTGGSDGYVRTWGRGSKKR